MLVRLVASGHLLEVGASAEVAARSDEHHSADVVVGVCFDHGVVQHDEHLAVDGVHSFRTVEGDDQKVAVTFGEYRRHGSRL